ncbi:hypothetical protein V7128_20745, partial [Neobacillus vireti]|uniref:hypothetical protein n=1 Tax=Neobacillus vireti TaxID=220686 RepID=UPI0030008301
KNPSKFICMMDLKRIFRAIVLKLEKMTNVQILFNISQTIIAFSCYDVTIKKQGVIRHDDL